MKVKITPIDEIISRNLTRILIEKNIQPTEFSRLSGIAIETISKYMHAKYPIGKEVMLTLCSILNVRPFEFYREDVQDVVSKTQISYQAGCDAPAICKKICRVCKKLLPDDQQAFSNLADILESDQERTKVAIKDNLIEFQEKVTWKRQMGGTEDDCKIQESTGGALRGRTAKQD